MNLNFTNKNIYPALQKLAMECEDVIGLSKEDIIAIHNEVIKLFGGDYGIRDKNLLESVCKAPYQSAFGIDLYPSIIHKAAKILFDFSHYQIFVDGNKRCGLAAANVFLEKNGYELNMDAEKQYFLVMDIANNVIKDAEEISDILKNNAKFSKLEYAEQELEQY